MTHAVFISAFTDRQLYDKCISNNNFIKNNANISTRGYDNTSENQSISKRYNQFLNSWDYTREAWFVFCHSDWEVLEDITQKLGNIDKSTLWGPIGAKLLKKDKEWLQFFCGTIQERSRDGTISRTVWNRHSDTGTLVDTFDAQCLIVHSSLVHRFSLRFDEGFLFDLYAEDFCVNAKTSFGIDSRILHLECRHNSIATTMEGRGGFFDMVNFFNKKWAENGGAWGQVVMALGKVLQPVKYFPPKIKDTRATTYKRPNVESLINNKNDAMTFAFDFVKPKSRVLDAGCAAGDLGILLREHKSCQVFGMDYNAESVELARSTGKFENCRQINLDTFEAQDLHDIGKFDYIILGDVCEHLRDPVETLTKLKSLLTPGGAFCLSIPNVAHASVKAALMLNRWDYKDVGLMDRTHIHMFSWKSIATELADANLAIESVRPTFFGIKHMLDFNPFIQLPSSIRKFILGDIHSYIGQYVMICRPSNDFHIEESNRRALEIDKKLYEKEMREFGSSYTGPIAKMHVALKLKLYYWKFRSAKNITRQWKFQEKIIKTLDQIRL